MGDGGGIQAQAVAPELPSSAPHQLLLDLPISWTPMIFFFFLNKESDNYDHFIRKGTYTVCSVVFGALNLVHIFLCLCVWISFILF